MTNPTTPDLKAQPFDEDFAEVYTFFPTERPARRAARKLPPSAATATVSVLHPQEGDGPGNPARSVTTTPVADDGLPFEDFDDSPQNLARQARFERERQEQLEKAKVANSTTLYEEDAAPTQPVPAVVAAAPASCKADTFLGVLIASPGLARQVAALPFKTETIAYGDDNNLSEAVLIEAIRNIEAQPADWLAAIREQLRELRRGSVNLRQFQGAVAEVVDQMLADGWLERARDEVPAKVYAVDTVQRWFQTHVMGKNSKIAEEASLLQGIAALTLDAIEGIEPQQATTSFVPFPLHLLPPAAREMVEQTARSKCVDPAMAALPALVQMASAIGMTRQIAGKSDWREHPIIWAGIIAKSGQLKTPTLDAILAPMKTRQLQLKAVYDEAKAKERKAEKAAEESNQPFITPKLQHVLTNDATMEAFGAMLSSSPRGLTNYADELTKWLCLGEYKPKASGDDARALELFNGGLCKIDRKSEKEPLLIKRAGAWVIGGIQPGVFWPALGLVGVVNGKLARHLLIMPPNRMQGWSDDVVSAEVALRWNELNARLYQFAFDNNGDPEIVTLSEPARPMLKGFVNDIEQEIRIEPDEKVSAMLNKMRGYALKFALVFHCARQAEQEGPAGHVYSNEWRECRLEEMSRGIELARWFAAEMRRIYGLKGQMSAGNDDAEFFAFIRSKGSVTPRDLMQYNRIRYSTAKAAKDELDQLVESGVGHWVTAKKPGSRKATKQFMLEAAEAGGPTLSGA